MRKITIRQVGEYEITLSTYGNFFILKIEKVSPDPFNELFDEKDYESVQSITLKFEDIEKIYQMAKKIKEEGNNDANDNIL